MDLTRDPTSWDDCGLDWSAPDPRNLLYWRAIALALAERGADVSDVFSRFRPSAIPTRRMLQGLIRALSGVADKYLDVNIDQGKWHLAENEFPNITTGRLCEICGDEWMRIPPTASRILGAEGSRCLSSLRAAIDTLRYTSADNWHYDRVYPRGYRDTYGGDLSLDADSTSDAWDYVDENFTDGFPGPQYSPLMMTVYRQRYCFMKPEGSTDPWPINYHWELVGHGIEVHQATDCRAINLFGHTVGVHAYYCAPIGPHDDTQAETFDGFGYVDGEGWTDLGVIAAGGTFNFNLPTPGAVVHTALPLMPANPPPVDPTNPPAAYESMIYQGTIGWRQFGMYLDHAVTGGFDFHPSQS